MALSLLTRLAAFAGLGTLLTGCCANNVCDCPNEAQADAIGIVFNPSKFPNPNELDTLVVVRYLHYDAKKPPAVLPKPETVTLVRTAAQIAANAPLIINNTAPFSQFGSARLDTFSYVVRYYPGTNPKSRPSKLALVIDSVRLKGSLDGNGCCTCYTNSRKLVKARRDSTQKGSYTNLREQPALVIE
jgi:hypothetical protein